MLEHKVIRHVDLGGNMITRLHRPRTAQKMSVIEWGTAALVVVTLIMFAKILIS